MTYPRNSIHALVNAVNNDIHCEIKNGLTVWRLTTPIVVIPHR